MSQTETLKQYAQQKTEQQISLLAEAPELIRQVQAMRRELQALPEAIAQSTASSLAPLDTMAQALDQGLDTQRAIMAPLIKEARESLRSQMEALAYDRVRRSVVLAREQHRKALQANRAGQGWMKEAKASRTEKASMQARIQQLILRFWIAAGVAAALFAALVLMILGRGL